MPDNIQSAPEGGAGRDSSHCPTGEGLRALLLEFISRRTPLLPTVLPVHSEEVRPVPLRDHPATHSGTLNRRWLWGPLQLRGCEGRGCWSGRRPGLRPAAGMVLECSETGDGSQGLREQGPGKRRQDSTGSGGRAQSLPSRPAFSWGASTAPRHSYHRARLAQGSVMWATPYFPLPQFPHPAPAILDRK